MPPKANNKPVFADAILPDGPSRAGALGAGFGLECLALAAVVIIPIFMPHKLVVAARELITPISAPHIEAWKPQPPPKPVVKIVKKVELPKPIEVAKVEIPKPKIYNPVITNPIVPKTQVVKKTAAPDVEMAKVLPPIMGSSAIPTIKKPREEVQTGGFGDPNSVPDNHNPNRAPNMSAMGGFDMPAGPGSGNGTGGAKGAKGVVASTGFGDQVAAGSTGGPKGSVQQGLFGDEKAATGQVKQTAAKVDSFKPMELVFVPKPEYTQEAREKKVEGDVVIQVMFTASGEVKVIRVVQGLGYGLDEAAESAARQIRFHPATQDGQPVDTTANVRMKCALAY
ncbi:MAG TPA: energy transducer TonB [Candidatus Acidoferrum sp.]|jgi:TonB family protein|nr:energy transducer TonB [Candidatus Acidoferrum sp.]